jgi:hypothetical protein
MLDACTGLGDLCLPLEPHVPRKPHYDPDTINLERGTYPKNARWKVDQDYIEKLGPEERKWLSKFLKEYVKAAVKKNDTSALHNTKELRRSCYNASNACRRDLMAILGGTGGLSTLIEDMDGVSQLASESPEETLIQWLDGEG